MPQDRLELSERRACLIVGQHRSTQRREVIRTKGDDALRARLHAFSRKHKRWGYRKAWGVLRNEGWVANRKKIQRLWREEGLKVPSRTRNAGTWGPQPVLQTACAPNDPITSGLSTSSSIGPQTARSSNC